MTDILDILADVLIEGGCTDSYSVAQAALASLRQAGWTVVPREITNEMFNAMNERFDNDDDLDARALWTVALAAAPQAGEGK